MTTREQSLDERPTDSELYQRELSRAHGAGHDEGYAEARAEWLWKFWKQAQRAPKIQRWILEQVERITSKRPWPEGVNQPGVDEVT